ncbi:hypothetical protein ZIOFF_043287 [Zingiber officinale]|uniref:Uncharacterized protein n=1 Tax=Zingiber officinale TaxID=94328 RepID=A0A8J5KW67_ZINOF|nr:hypothetical protein ZIOFF_043287 [Zingiber officinale]
MDAFRLGLLSPSPSPVIPRTHLGSLGLNYVVAAQVPVFCFQILKAIPDKVLATANREYSKEREKHEFDQCLKYLKRQLLHEHDLWYLFPHNMEKHSLPVSVEVDAKVTSISGNNNTIPIEDTPHSGSGAPSDVLELSTKAMIASKRPVFLVDQSNISDIEFDKSHFFRFDLMRLEDVKERLRLQTKREPTLAEWAQAVGISCHGLQSCLSSGRHSRDKMISANLRLVVHVARQYEGKGLDLQDLLQEGSKGLMKSFEKFKPGAGSRFPTYAYWWIRHSIKKAIFQNSRTIRIPVEFWPYNFIHIKLHYQLSLQENAFAVLKNIKNARRLCIQEGHLPTNEEVAKRVGITVDKLESLLLNTRIPVSIEGRPWSDHDATFQVI